MSGQATYAEWIAVDWGTTNLRAWAMRGDAALDHVASDAGMARLSPSEFEPTLIRHIDAWLGTEPVPVVICGMAGSRQGWFEAPYRKVPASPLAAMQPVSADDNRLKPFIIQGLKQETPPDVMRGEETQIAGFLAQAPKFDGVICLPGTHSKWVHISAGEVVSFQTFMTGELFDLLSQASVLRHSVETDDSDDAAFSDALADTLSRPESLALKLFQIRAGDLLAATPAPTCRARLSGLLLGAELAAARPYWLGQQIALIGAPKLTKLYATALSDQGVAPTEHVGDDMTLKGLSAAYRELAT